MFPMRRSCPGKFPAGVMTPFCMGLLAGACLLAGSCSTASEDPAKPLPDLPRPVMRILSEDIALSPGLGYVQDMGPGWNLGNTLDSVQGTGRITSPAKAETAWGNPVTTRAMIDAVKAAGFRTVRIPVSWGQKTGPAPGYPIDPAWMARVRQVVEYVTHSGMHAILNVHHDNSWLVPDRAHEAEATRQLVATWTQIAREFRDAGPLLIFEGMNEPRLEGHPQEWSGGTPEARQIINRWGSAFVEAVRATGGRNADRWLMVPGYAASGSPLVLDSLVLPEDPHIIVSIHNYFPYAFALADPKDKASHDRWGSPVDLRDMQAEFDRYFDRFVSRGIPVVLGEFGARNKNNTPQRERWARQFIAEARARGIPCVWWDNQGFRGNGENFGLLDRKALEWRYKGIVQALMEGMTYTE